VQLKESKGGDVVIPSPRLNRVETEVEQLGLGPSITDQKALDAEFEERV
jgi:hypothetical protein